MTSPDTLHRWRDRCLMAAAAWVGWPATSSAQAPPAAAYRPVQIEWRAAAGCPGREAALAHVAGLLGHAPETTRALSARVVIAPAAEDRWVARVELTTPDGASSTREIASGSCARATEAAGLILALAIDPGAVTARAAAPPRPPRAASRLRVQGLVRLDATGDLGMFPAVTAGGSLAVGLVVGVARFELAATYWLGQRVPVPTLPRAAADLQLIAGTVRGCVVYAASRVEVGPCGGLEAGVMNAAGRGVANPVTTAVPWLVGLLGLTVAWRPLDRLAIRAGLELGATIARARFVINGLGPIYQPSLLSGRVLLGVEVRFP